jgi:hypothetical protein
MHLSVHRRHACVYTIIFVWGVTFLWQEISIPLPFSKEVKFNVQSPNKGENHSPKQSLENTTVSVVSAPMADHVVVAPPPSLQAGRPQYERTKLLYRRATILIQLSGEMANNLHHIAHGYSLKLMAKEEFDIDCNLVLRHHEGPNNRAPKPKWKSARDNIQQCFPKLSDWNFEEGNHNNIFLERRNLQLSWLQEKHDQLYGLVNSRHLSEIRQGLKVLSEEVLTDADRPWIDEAKSAIRVPYLYLESLDVLPMIDHYFDHLRELLVFNDKACCARLPESTESVFHFRNYESEMPERRAFEMGFAELSPVKVATELFAHLQPGDRVQIITRTFNQKARNYAEALEVNGVKASVVTDQSTVQDFCFLKQTQKELVGSARSTFVMWAALLGDSQKARMYHVDNRGLRNRHPDFWERFTYNFTHPRLRDRLIFELYRDDK